MGTFSIWHWAIVGIVVLLMFGRGRISDVMGEVGKGITAFRNGITGPQTAQSEPAATAAPAPAEADAARRQG